MRIKLPLFTALCFLNLLSTAGAQNDAPLEDYTPPPMFGTAPRVTPPEEQSKTKPKRTPKKELKKPSQQIKNSSAKKIPPPLKIESIQTKATPPKSAPVTNPKPVEKKTTPAPSRKPNGPKAKTLTNTPQKKEKHQGIVKGPKTMPAVKKQSVESEVLFEPSTQEPINLLDRAQKKNKSPITTNIRTKKPTPPPLTNDNFPLPSFSLLPNGKKKLNLLFPENQKILKDEQLNTLNQMILPLLKENNDMRLHVEAYASPQKNSLNGDKRVALARGFAIRQYLIDNNIAPNRLDIRAVGSETDTHPMDRIEIFLSSE